MTKERYFIEKNNQLRRQLTPENEKYYSDLLLYIRLNSFIQDQEAIESRLLEILQDIIDAQTDYIPAKQYFGKNPKKIADDLPNQFPKSLSKFFKGLSFVFIIYLFFFSLPSMTSPNSTFDLGTFVLVGLYVVFVIFLSFKYLGTTIYKINSQNDSKLRKSITAFLIGIVFIAPIFLILLLINTPFQITITNGLGIGIILFWLAVGIVLFSKQDDKKIWLPLAFFYLVLSILGIAMRLPGNIGFFLSNTRTGQTIILIILLVAFVVFSIINFFVVRKD